MAITTHNTQHCVPKLPWCHCFLLPTHRYKHWNLSHEEEETNHHSVWHASYLNLCNTESDSQQVAFHITCRTVQYVTYTLCMSQFYIMLNMISYMISSFLSFELKEISSYYHLMQCLTLYTFLKANNTAIEYNWSMAHHSPCTQSLRYRSTGHPGSERVRSHWVHSTTGVQQTRQHSWWPTRNRSVGYV